MTIQDAIKAGFHVSIIGASRWLEWEDGLWKVFEFKRAAIKKTTIIATDDEAEAVAALMEATR